MPQLVPQPQDLRADAPAEAARLSVVPPARQTSRELLTAWLLLLLERQPSHGYELHRQLQAYGVQTEMGVMYRTLRKLEDGGCAASRWTESVAGPRRRRYELTDAGRRELDELVDSITSTRDRHSAFLDARASARDEKKVAA